MVNFWVSLAFVRNRPSYALLKVCSVRVESVLLRVGWKRKGSWVQKQCLAEQVSNPAMNRHSEEVWKNDGVKQIGHVCWKEGCCEDVQRVWFIQFSSFFLLCRWCTPLLHLWDEAQGFGFLFNSFITVLDLAIKRISTFSCKIFALRKSASQRLKMNKRVLSFYRFWIVCSFFVMGSNSPY